MRGWAVWQIVAVAAMWLVLGGPARASLTFDALHFDMFDLVVVSGSFSTDDSLAPFVALVRQSGATVVTFRSPGGSVVKAIELGRLIRSLRLNTLQVSRGECESACALAFFGGVVRIAEPGSIGMHRSSFASYDLGVADAVSAVQQLTAETMTYMGEMGVDPALLQLALQYDANDMRYLSRSEMERYRVVASASQTALAPPASAGSSPGQPALATAPDLSIPTARSGRAQHPAGTVELRAAPDPKSPVVGHLANGTAVSIIGGSQSWYRVRAGRVEGYAHFATISVDQFDGLGFGERKIQVKSVRSYAEARAYVIGANIPLVAYLTTSGWFAVATSESFLNKQVGIAALRQLKSRSLVPADSVLTYGNTYVRRVCCD